MQGKALRIRAARRRAAGLAALVLAIAGAAPVLAEAPQPWGMGMLPGASPVREQLDSFHDMLLLVIFGIAAFVFVLLAIVAVRFNARANPNPSKTAHNTVLEIVWTALPVVVLFVIGFPSMKLLYYSDRAVKPDLTIKVTGHQWYWSYEYPDHGNIAVDSRPIWDGPGTTDEQAAELLREAAPKWLIPTDKPLRLLEADNRLVVPVGANIRVLITAADVIHAWYLPSMGVQKAAVPGRLNETWMKIDREGVYYGQCTQICGTGHGYMPVVVEAVSPDRFQSWTRLKRAAGAVGDDGSSIRLATGSAE